MNVKGRPDRGARPRARHSNSSHISRAVRVPDVGSRAGVFIIWLEGQCHRFTSFEILSIPRCCTASPPSLWPLQLLCVGAVRADSSPVGTNFL